MDWINKLQMISEKMKNQMHAKGIDSLDKVYAIISNFDPENLGYCEKINFETFLSKMGIFLKTQELTEFHKFLYTAENGAKVPFENFVNSLKCDVPHQILHVSQQIFSLLTEGNNTISLENLKAKLRVEAHPRVKIMIRSCDEIYSDFDFSLRFLGGDKGYFELNDFLELHRNMYYVQPKENITNFLTMIKEIWGYDRLIKK